MLPDPHAHPQPGWRGDTLLHAVAALIVAAALFIGMGGWPTLIRLLEALA